MAENNNKMTIKGDDLAVHGAPLGKFIDILASGALLSNHEMERLGKTGGRTFNFEKDVTYGAQKSNIEAHNVCVLLNEFYGFGESLAGSTSAPYFLLPAAKLAQQGYRFMDQDGFHLLPPDYQGPQDKRGTHVVLSDAPFRIAASKTQIGVLKHVMQKCGQYSQEQIDNTFIEATNLRDPAVRETALEQARQSLNLSSNVAQAVILEKDDNPPLVLTRASPDGDRSTHFKAKTATEPYAPKDVVLPAPLQIETRTSNGHTVFEIGMGGAVTTFADEKVRRQWERIRPEIRENMETCSSENMPSVVIWDSQKSPHVVGLNSKAGTTSFSPSSDERLQTASSALCSKYIGGAVREKLSSAASSRLTTSLTKSTGQKPVFQAQI